VPWFEPVIMVCYATKYCIVKLKSIALAACLLIAASSLLASPEDDQAAGVKRATELASLMQLGEQMKTSVGEKTNQMLGKAMTLLGVPYKRGGSTAETGFDCSGFVRHIYETSIGRLLPRRAEEQATVTDKIDRSELNPGDLVFFNTMRRTFSHVGIYLGDGKFIHAPSVGKAVRVDDLRTAYWTKRFTGARRVQETQTPETANR
jgi:cell wall-associated NlpC family hydrolase